MSKDHKPDHELERERILKAGGYVQFGRVNGSLNLARAIGDSCLSNVHMNLVCGKADCLFSG